MPLLRFKELCRQVSSFFRSQMLHCCDMTRSLLKFSLLTLLLLTAGCESQKFKPAAWDAAPRVKDSALDDFDTGTKKPSRRIPPLPEVTDWMSPSSPRRRVSGSPYRGNVSPYRGNFSPYRGDASPYRGYVSAPGGASPYRGDSANRYPATKFPYRGYVNPLRPDLSGQQSLYRGNQKTPKRQYGEWNSPSQAYRGNQGPARNDPYRSNLQRSPYRGN